MNYRNIVRKRVAFGLAGAAIILRMASDWIFPNGGPLYYQAIQAGLLLLAIILLWQQLETGIIGGLAIAWTRFGGVQWPTLAQAAILIGNNLFFPVVEELEFRGFFLSWMLEKRVSAGYAVWLVAGIHLLAHIHLFLQHNYTMVVVTLLVFVWYGFITVRTRSLWGAVIAHASVNIFGFLPSAGSGTDIMRTNQ